MTDIVAKRRTLDLAWFYFHSAMVSKTKPASLLDGLHSVYTEKILPLESSFKFDSFYSPLLTETEFKCKPLVLLLGQYSTGKTTFIESLLGRDYPGGRVGPEPTVQTVYLLVDV